MQHLKGIIFCKVKILNFARIYYTIHLYVGLMFVYEPFSSF